MDKFEAEELDKIVTAYYNSRIHVSSDTPMSAPKQSNNKKEHPLYCVTFQVSPIFDTTEVTIGELSYFYDEAYYFDRADSMHRVTELSKSFARFAKDVSGFPGSYVMVNTYRGIVVANDPDNMFSFDSIAGDVTVFDNGQMRLYDDHSRPINNLIPLALFEAKQSEETCESLLSRLHGTMRTLGVSDNGYCFVPIPRYSGIMSNPSMIMKEEDLSGDITKLSKRLEASEALLTYNIDKQEGRRLDYGE